MSMIFPSKRRMKRTTQKLVAKFENIGNIADDSSISHLILIGKLFYWLQKYMSRRQFEENKI
jgi:hypothetical protein